MLRERYSLTDGMLDKMTRAEQRETAAFSVAVDKVAHEDMKVVYPAPDRSERPAHCGRRVVRRVLGTATVVAPNDRA